MLLHLFCHISLRYLTWFEVFLISLEMTHPGATDLVDKGVLGAAHSMIPASLSDVDRTMEETFMKFAKGSGTFFCIVVL